MGHGPVKEPTAKPTEDAASRMDRTVHAREELAAAGLVIGALEHLTIEQQRRVISSVDDLLGLDLKRTCRAHEE